jgi:RHS repeat-associated protein
MEFDGAGGFLARYAHGDRVDQPLAMSRAGQDYYIQADHQGSVIRVTDAAGAVVNSYDYDAYGQRLSALEGVEIAYGYTGREYDAESGLMYYRLRVYDPAMGRFLQTDPLGFAAGDLNLYRYVGNDPLNVTDPSGKNPLSALIAVGACAGGAAIGVGSLAIGVTISIALDASSKPMFPPPAAPAKAPVPKPKADPPTGSSGCGTDSAGGSSEASNNLPFNVDPSDFGFPPEIDLGIQGFLIAGEGCTAGLATLANPKVGTFALAVVSVQGVLTGLSLGHDLVAPIDP